MLVVHKKTFMISFQLLILIIMFTTTVFTSKIIIVIIIQQSKLVIFITIKLPNYNNEYFYYDFLVKNIHLIRQQHNIIHL